MAKKFVFKLDVVLKERKRQEEQKLHEWVLSRTILQKMIDYCNELKERLSKAIVEATELASLPTNSSAQLLAMHDFIEATKKRITWKSNEIEKGSKLVEKKRIEYVTAAQKRQSLEKLKERRLDEYKEQIAKKELKELDDVYIMRGVRDYE